MLGEFEELILLALLRLGEGAFGRTIRRDIEGRTGRRVSMSAVYTTLERMEGKGLVGSRVGDPTPRRGGRRKKCFSLTLQGGEALKESYEGYKNMIRGLERQLESL